MHWWTAAAAGAALLAMAGCVSECHFDTDCEGILVCVEGRCVESESARRAARGQCVVTTDCALGEQCQGGICRRAVTPDGGSDDGGPDGGVDPRECLTAAGCTAPEVCTFTGTAVSCGQAPCPLMTECRPRSGRIPLGHACNTHEDCAGGWCQGGVCALPCRSDPDCPGGYGCVEGVYQPPGGQQGSAKLCMPTAPEERICDVDEVCPTGEVCTWDLAREGRTHCANPAGPRPGGEACDPFEACRSGLCVTNGKDDRCTNPCLDDLDCAAGQACGEMTLNEVPGQPKVAACTPPDVACYKALQCKTAEGAWCALSLSLSADHLLFLCKNNTTGGAPGTPCTDGGECKTRICTPEGLCSNVCDTDADCLCAYGPGCTTCSAGDPCHLGWRCVPTELPAGPTRTETVRICRP